MITDILLSILKGLPWLNKGLLLLHIFTSSPDWFSGLSSSVCVCVSQAFSRAWSRLHIFTSSPDWFTGLSASVVFGQSDNLTLQSPKSKYKFSFLYPYISYRRSREKLLKYQDNSLWVIMKLILMTSLFD